MLTRPLVWIAALPLVFGLMSGARGGSAPDASSGDAVVAPVKRVAPKTPSFEHLNEKPAAAAKKLPARAVKVAPDTPDCDAGYKVDGTGTRCIATGSINTGKRRGKR